MRSGQSHLISRCITVILQSVGLLGICNQGRCWRLPAPCASAHQQPALAPAPEDGESSRRPSWCWPTRADSQHQLQAQDLPQPPSCSRLVHAHCPHVCSALVSADDPHATVCTAPCEAPTAPSNFLQGKIKNQTWVYHWKFEWMNLILQFVLISTLEIFESQEHCLHDLS